MMLKNRVIMLSADFGLHCVAHMSHADSEPKARLRAEPHMEHMPLPNGSPQTVDR